MGKSTVLPSSPSRRAGRKYYGNYASKRTRWDLAIRKSNALKVHYRLLRKTRHSDRERGRTRKRDREREIEKFSRTGETSRSKQEEKFNWSWSSS